MLTQQFFFFVKWLKSCTILVFPWLLLFGFGCRNVYYWYDYFNFPNWKRVSKATNYPKRRQIVTFITCSLGSFDVKLFRCYSLKMQSLVRNERFCFFIGNLCLLNGERSEFSASKSSNQFVMKLSIHTHTCTACATNILSVLLGLLHTG